MNTEKNELNDSSPLDKEKIKEAVDIDKKLKHYKDNINYNSFKEEKNLVLESVKNRKNKLHERNNSMNYFNPSIRNQDESLNIENHGSDSPNSLHRKYSLEKRIRDFKKKISDDLHENSYFNNLKTIGCKFFFKFLC